MDHLLTKIDKSSERENLSIYRRILFEEFENESCFYCGKKLSNDGQKVHVDHFVPRAFIKDDKMWNFVLSCPSCNERKNNRVPRKDYVVLIENRNKKIRLSENVVVQTDFAEYSEGLIERMWHYAKMSGLKEFKNF